MKKINLTPILILLMVLSTFKMVAKTHAQAVPISLVALSTFSDLRAQTPQPSQMIQLLGITSFGDGNGGTYYWNASSTLPDDGFKVAQVAGMPTGRWLRFSTSDTGSANTSAISLQATYTIPFGVTYPFIPRTVTVIARSANAGGGGFVVPGSITNSNFQYTFNSVPALGTISIDFVIQKQ